MSLKVLIDLQQTFTVFPIEQAMMNVLMRLRCIMMVDIFHNVKLHGEYLILTITTEKFLLSDSHFIWINKVMFFMVKVIQLICFSISKTSREPNF